MHSSLGVSPFEAAHGLPARGVHQHVDAANYNAPSYMDKPGIEAMQSTAKAFMTHLRQVQTQEEKVRAAMLNAKGHPPKLSVGDQVAFFIPPTAEEAELAARKAKHLPQFRGPARITRVLTPTTFELRFKNRTYKRCLSELRRYRATGEPLLDVGVAPDEVSSFELNAYIAYRDTDDANDDDSRRFHLGKVTNIVDGQAHVHCYATKGKALSRAEWRPLYQTANGVFRLGNARHCEPVMDHIPLDEDEWVWHYNVRLNANDRILKQVRRQLEHEEVTHHRLGHTF